jgi:hypothetical protein
MYSFVLEKDPTKVGNLPLRLHYGLTASQSSTKTEFYDRTQTAVGVQARLQMNSVPLDRDSSAFASLVVKKVEGSNTAPGLTWIADVSLNRRFGRNASLVLNYNYTTTRTTASPARSLVSIRSVSRGTTRPDGRRFRSLEARAWTLTV